MIDRNASSLIKMTKTNIGIGNSESKFFFLK